MAQPSESTSTPTTPSTPAHQDGFPAATLQARRFCQIFRHLSVKRNPAHGAIEDAESRLARPQGSVGWLAFPNPSALDTTFPAALLRLWQSCQAAYGAVPAQNQSADPPKPELAPESCQGFHENGFGIAYGDFHVIPIQLGGLHKGSSATDAYRDLGKNGQSPLFLYETLALLVGIPDVAQQIMQGTASLRLLERIRDSLNPADHLLKRKGRNRVPEFAVLSGNGSQILLSGDPSPNKVPEAGHGIGLATRFAVATPHTYACR